MNDLGSGRYAGLTGALEARVDALASRHRLGREVSSRLRILAELLAGDPRAPTTIRDPVEVIERHLADSLVALELEPVRLAGTAVDLGSGPGLPGLALAAALPSTQFVLLDSSSRKTAFIERAVEACALHNVEVVHERAESFAWERPDYDLVTARAVAALDVTAEYAAPLLRIGGTLVAWVGRRSPEADAVLPRVLFELGMEGPAVRRVEPFPSARYHHLYLMSKVRPTPGRFPRRPGVALKRPLGAARRPAPPSDRGRR